MKWLCQRLLPIIIHMGAWTYDTEWLEMDGYRALVSYKNMKSLSVRVKPPHGAVTVSVPLFTPKNVIVAFLRDRHDWVVHSQSTVSVPPVGAGPLVTGGRVPLWGAGREIVVEDAARATAKTRDGRIYIRCPTGDDDAARRAVDSLYRQELGEVVDRLLEQWQPRVGRNATGVKLKRMKSRWGSCNTITGALTFNTMLAKFHPEALEYVVVHELVHLLERGHGQLFKSYMSAFLPDWSARRQMLEEGPC